MAHIVAVLWKYRPASDGKYNIRIRITKHRKSSYINIPYRVSIDEWDERKRIVRKKHPASSKINHFINKTIADIQNSAIDAEIKAYSLTVFCCALAI